MQETHLGPRLVSQLEILQENLDQRVAGKLPEPRSWLGPLYPNPEAPSESRDCPTCHGHGSKIHSTDSALMWHLAITMVCNDCQGRGWYE